MLVQSADVGHFTVRELGNRAFGGLHVGCQMGGVHVNLPKFAMFMIFRKYEVGEVLVIMAQFILNGPLFGPCYRDQFSNSVLTQSILSGLAWMLATMVSFDIAGLLGSMNYLKAAPGADALFFLWGHPRLQVGGVPCSVGRVRTCDEFDQYLHFCK